MNGKMLRCPSYLFVLPGIIDNSQTLYYSSEHYGNYNFANFCVYFVDSDGKKSSYWESCTPATAGYYEAACQTAKDQNQGPEFLGFFIQGLEGLEKCFGEHSWKIICSIHSPLIFLLCRLQLLRFYMYSSLFIMNPGKSCISMLPGIRRQGGLHSKLSKPVHEKGDRFVFGVVRIRMGVSDWGSGWGCRVTRKQGNPLWLEMC